MSPSRSAFLISIFTVELRGIISSINFALIAVVLGVPGVTELIVPELVRGAKSPIHTFQAGSSFVGNLPSAIMPDSHSSTGRTGPVACPCCLLTHQVIHPRQVIFLHLHQVWAKVDTGYKDEKVHIQSARNRVAF